MADSNLTVQTFNTTMSPDKAADDDDQSPVQVLEAYTVVLSTTCHLLSLFFGGGSSLAVVVAVVTRRNISKYSYSLILLFLTACCCVNFIYTPMEIVDLLLYHNRYRHPSRDLVGSTTAVYLFLMAIVAVVIAFLAVEGFLRITNRYGGLVQRIWPLVAVVATLVAMSLVMIGILAGPIADHPRLENGYYVIVDGGVRSAFLSLLVVLLCVAVLTFVFLVVQLLRSHCYWEDGRPHFRQKKLKLTIPEFLISQSNNACEEEESGFENDHDQSRTPSPSTPKLLTVSEQVKGEDVTPVSELPKQAASPRSSGNRLGINMSQVLGRRRHTICQISDSSSPSAAPVDPIVRAKQYNYVRKFSVDISALQAQLQNPKIFKEAPFQSDIDLTKKQDSKTPEPPKPLLPLKPLNCEAEVKPKPELPDRSEKPVTSLPVPPPPVIMVSNEDVLPESDEGEATTTTTTTTTTITTVTASNPVNGDGMNGKTNETVFTQPAITIQKPVSLSLKDTCTDDLISAPTLESAITDPSELETEGLKIVRLALCMALTFIITVLPVIITETLRNSLSEHAFVNISTCTLAVSTIQTIVYPNLLVCLDEVIHKAVQKLKNRVRHIVTCSSKLDDQHTHVEESSSISQV